LTLAVAVFVSIGAQACACTVTRQVLPGGPSPAMPPPKAKTRLGTFLKRDMMQAKPCKQLGDNVRIQASPRQDSRRWLRLQQISIAGRKQDFEVVSDR
jgi:hypothetical protein